MSDDIGKWEEEGRPIPAPPSFKKAMIRKFAEEYGYRVFVETGTHIGSTVSAVQDLFQEIHTIELSDKLFTRCKESFRGNDKINLYHGASEDVLPGIIEKIKEPIIFWLDAHYSEGETAKGITSSSLHKELPVILNHFIDNHVILIDDTYALVDNDGYLSSETISKMVLKKYPHYKISIDGYVLRATPK